MFINVLRKEKRGQVRTVFVVGYGPCESFRSFTDGTHLTWLFIRLERLQEMDWSRKSAAFEYFEFGNCCVTILCLLKWSHKVHWSQHLQFTISLCESSCCRCSIAVALRRPLLSLSTSRGAMCHAFALEELPLRDAQSDSDVEGRLLTTVKDSKSLKQLIVVDRKTPQSPWAEAHRKWGRTRYDKAWQGTQPKCMSMPQ